MIEPHQNWFIAVKPVEAITSALKEQLNAMGVEVLHDELYIHAHFFIPEPVFPHADETLRSHGFSLTDKHPPICSIGQQEGYDIFEKRVPLIEVTEARSIASLAEQGVCMSGGAGKPHVHIKIPADKKEEINQLMAENQYFLKTDLPVGKAGCH